MQARRPRPFPGGAHHFFVISKLGGPRFTTRDRCSCARRSPEPLAGKRAVSGPQGTIVCGNAGSFLKLPDKGRYWQRNCQNGIISL